MNKEYIKKVIAVFSIVILLSFTTGCKKGELHSKEEMIDYIDSLNCATDYYNAKEDTTNNPLYACNLKGKYTILSEEVIDGELGKERVMSIKLNDFDYTFKLLSSYRCSSSFDGNCNTYTYKIWTDYLFDAKGYFALKYIEKAGNNNGMCESTETFFKCYLNKKDEINSLASYLNGYMEYINGLDFRTLDYLPNFKIEFPSKQDAGGRNIYDSVYIYLVDGKYILRTDGKDPYTINDLKQYLLEIGRENYIFD